MSLLCWTVLTERFPGEVNGSQAGNRLIILSVTYSGTHDGILMNI